MSEAKAFQCDYCGKIYGEYPDGWLMLKPYEGTMILWRANAAKTFIVGKDIRIDFCNTDHFEKFLKAKLSEGTDVDAQTQQASPSGF